MKHVQLENTAKNVVKNVSAKTKDNVILKVECVIVHLAGRVMSVQIVVNLAILVLIVKMSVNVITVVIVIMLLENVNVAQDLRAQNAWTVVRAILLDSIAPKLVVVRIKQSVINQPAIVLARKDGPVSIAVREIVPTICTGLTVRKFANVMQTTRICAIHGPVNAIVKLVGAAAFVIDHVLSLRTVKIVKYPVTARTAPNVRRQMVLHYPNTTKRTEF